MAEQLRGGRFLGRTLRRKSLAGVTMANVLYPAGARLPRHSHELAYFCLIHRGTYSEAYGRRTRTCRPMTLAFHPPGESHSETLANTSVASFNVEIGAELLYRASELLGPLDQPAEFQGGPVASLAHQLFEEFGASHPDSILAVESLTFEILAAASGFNRAAEALPRQNWLAKAHDLLDVHFREPLTLRDISRRAGVHPVHFAAAFRSSYRCSVGEYLRRRRLEYACRKLAEQDLPLAEIALEAGFADQSHLTRTLKRYTGQTPGQFRKRASGPN